jgi:hypothetical protein
LEAQQERRLNKKVSKKHDATIHFKVRVRAIDIAMKRGSRDWGDYYTEALDQLRAEGTIPK